MHDLLIRKEVNDIYYNQHALIKVLVFLCLTDAFSESVKLIFTAFLSFSEWKHGESVLQWYRGHLGGISPEPEDSAAVRAN